MEKKTCQPTLLWGQKDVRGGWLTSRGGAPGAVCEANVGLKTLFFSLEF